MSVCVQSALSRSVLTPLASTIQGQYLRLSGISVIPNRATAERKRELQWDSSQITNVPLRGAWNPCLSYVL